MATTVDQVILPLGQALAELKRRKPWAPIAALRKAVAAGRIPARRSSESKRARYYVRLEDLEAALPKT
jgi:hypothetical protein